MREPPTFLSDAQVLRAVSEGWRTEVDAVEHLPVGFGAHHWVASLAGTPHLFVTLDRLASRSPPNFAAFITRPGVNCPRR